VDDEPETVKYVSANLRARGYDVLTAEDGRTALKVFSESVVIRRQSDVPIIMLSARGQERDIVRALDLGADDYLTKPFGVEEMLARVRATLRRTAQIGVTPRPPLVMEDLEMDFAARRVTVRGREVRLTSTEYNLLAHLAINAGRVLTHRALLQAVWGPEYGDETEYLWVYIRRLRRKIEPDPSNPCYILTEPGVGYFFVAPPQDKMPSCLTFPAYPPAGSTPAGG